MTAALRIDFISDIACPWCLIGLRNMEAALDELDGEIEAEIAFHPFELNPDLPAKGMDRETYFAEKYQLPADEAKRRGEEIKAAAAETGFEMNTGKGFRLRNTFDAHRLLEWAGEEGGQSMLKHALFRAYFGDGRDISDAGELRAIAEGAGLDGDRAAEILASDEYADDVRREEAAHRSHGIMAVPTIIVDGRYQINGSHPPERFAKAFRHIASERAAT